MINYIQQCWFMHVYLLRQLAAFAGYTLVPVRITHK
jgi:hypothetical protein